MVAGYVPERAQGLRDQEVVTRPEVDMHLIGMSLGELPDERALADAGFSTHQYDLAAGRIEVVEQPSQDREFFVPLEKHQQQLTEAVHIDT
jgi:hypothetical protein